MLDLNNAITDIVMSEEESLLSRNYEQSVFFASPFFTCAFIGSSDTGCMVH